jgi:hypothetical protein
MNQAAQSSPEYRFGAGRKQKKSVVFLLFSTVDSEPARLRHVLDGDKNAAGRHSTL